MFIRNRSSSKFHGKINEEGVFMSSHHLLRMLKVAEMKVTKQFTTEMTDITRIKGAVKSHKLASNFLAIVCYLPE